MLRPGKSLLYPFSAKRPIPKERISDPDADGRRLPCERERAGQNARLVLIMACRPAENAAQPQGCSVVISVTIVVMKPSPVVITGK
jgi:hypothetical protein